MSIRTINHRTPHCASLRFGPVVGYTSPKEEEEEDTTTWTVFDVFFVASVFQKFHVCDDDALARCGRAALCDVEAHNPGDDQRDRGPMRGAHHLAEHLRSDQRGSGGAYARPDGIGDA